MKQAEVEAFVESLENVEREENYGYIFFFVGDDHRFGFVTIGESDNEYDTVSNLNREGVYRVNIGISKKSYQALLGENDDSELDYTALNVFMPHPHYAKQHYICILNPSDANIDVMKELIIEAHSIAAERLKKKSSKTE